jgi:hypothetical protein
MSELIRLEDLTFQRWGNETMHNPKQRSALETILTAFLLCSLFASTGYAAAKPTALRAGAAAVDIASIH